MVLKDFLGVLAALMLGGLVAAPAEAYTYPVTSTTQGGRTSVTGAYRPVNFDFFVIPGSNSTVGIDDKFSIPSFLSFPGASVLDVSLTLFLTGIWVGDYEGAPSGKNAGIWELTLSNLVGVLPNNGSQMAVYWLDNGYVGDMYLRKEGVYTGLPPQDTPREGDLFKVYAKKSCAPENFEIFDIGPCHILDLDLGEDPKTDLVAMLIPGALVHVGPFIIPEGKTQYELDTERNAVNGTTTNRSGCGEIRPFVDEDGTVVPFSSARALPNNSQSAPEPSTIALFGLGLLGLGLGRLNASRRSSAVL